MATPSEHNRALKDSAPLLVFFASRPQPALVPRDWLWDGLSPEGRARLIESWQPPGLTAEKSPRAF